MKKSITEMVVGSILAQRSKFLYFFFLGKAKCGVEFCHYTHTLRYARQSVNRNITDYFFLSFKLYPAHSRVGRGNVVLRHSVPQFLPNSRGIAC